MKRNQNLNYIAAILVLLVINNITAFSELSEVISIDTRFSHSYSSLTETAIDLRKFSIGYSFSVDIDTRIPSGTLLLLK